ncbi:MAG: hypothetical protein KAF64_07500 [Hydrogenophaga sp.]|uniref:hypothetical protein n=1 Tax=Hydrogenophaga sp. TaxID=1904254 RepID=UPI0025C2A2E8|nr:hypothetical protein [Hydrogenophaga sp.]MBU7573181.1 hypothetical protein [Hydrogenophaga sp.]
MHNAPSVMFPVGRCGLYGVLLALLAVLGAAVLGLWYGLDATRGAAWSGVLGGTLWSIWVMGALWVWRRSPVGHLKWNALERRDPEAPAGVWHWYSESCAESVPLQRVERVMDWQGIVLLRLHSADAPARWIWAERGRNPALWNDLRRALISARA